MGLFKKLFSGEPSKKVVYPVVSNGMKGIFMKGIGMYWAHGCKPLVEEALKNGKGIQNFLVEAPSKDQAFVVYDPNQTNPEAIREAIIAAGYGVKRVETADPR